MLTHPTCLIDDIYQGYDNIVYTDGSKKDGGCAAA